MNRSKMYKRYRFPPEIIQITIWLYHRFNLGHRDIEDLLAKRGIVVSYEAIRLWCNKFGAKYAQRLRRNHQGFGDTFFIDEVFVKIQGSIHDTSQYANNRAELSHQPTRVIERGMRKFKSMHQAQRFLGAYATVYNLFKLGRHLVSAENYRFFRLRAFATWEKAVAI